MVDSTQNLWTELRTLPQEQKAPFSFWMVWVHVSVSYTPKWLAMLHHNQTWSEMMDRDTHMQQNNIWACSTTRSNYILLNPFLMTICAIWECESHSLKD